MNDNNLNNNINVTPEGNANPQPIPNPVPPQPVQPQPMPNTELGTPQPVPMNNGVVTPPQPLQPTTLPNQPVAPTPMPNPVEQPVMGATVQEPQPMPNNIPNQNTVPPTPQQPNQMMNQPVQPMPQQPVSQEKPPKQKSNPVLIVLMFVAIIGGAAYFGYNKFFANSSSNNGDQGTGTTVTDNTNAEITNDEAITIVKEIVKKYNQPYGIYCGEVDYNDNIEENGKKYSASKTYKSMEEINKYLESFLSNNFINNNIDKTNYLEKDSKLYCNIPERGTLIYQEEGSTFEIDDLTNNQIKASGTINNSREGGEIISSHFELTLVNENNNWLLNEYQEKE